LRTSRTETATRRDATRRARDFESIRDDDDFSLLFSFVFCNVTYYYCKNFVCIVVVVVVVVVPKLLLLMHAYHA